MARYRQFLNVPLSAISKQKNTSKSEPEQAKPGPAPGRSATPAASDPFDGWDRVHWQRFEDKKQAEAPSSSPPKEVIGNPFVATANMPPESRPTTLIPLPKLTANEILEEPVSIIPTLRKPFQTAAKKRTYSLTSFVNAEERKAIHLFCAAHKTTVAALVRQAVFERIGVDAEPSGPYKRKRGRPRKNPVIE